MRTLLPSRLLLLLMISLLAASNSGSAATSPPQDMMVRFSESIPPLPGGEGLAGSVAGMDGSLLVVAGGANFPDQPRWETDKAWHDRVFSIDLTSIEDGWRESEQRLARPLAYGVSLTHPEYGIISIGGADAERHHRDAFLLSIDPTTREVTESPLPDLPISLAYAAGALDGSVVHVFGGQETPDSTEASLRTFTLDLAEKEPAWRELDPLPAAGRILPVAATHRGDLLIFSGASLAPDDAGKPRRTYLTDAWRHNPRTGWRALQDLPRPAVAAPSPALPVGHDFLLIIGGSDGSLDDQVDALKDDHPGFPGDLLAYHPITDRWTTRGAFPREDGTSMLPPVTVPVVPIVGTGTDFDGRHLLASGEIRPRVRSPRMILVHPTSTESLLGMLDWIAIGIYGLILVGMGIYFMRRERGTEDFFLAGRRVPWWAAGISIFATQLSAITFMAIPAKSYDTDWIYFVQNLGILAMAPVVAYCLLPFFRRLSVTTAYEYLEYRFDVSLRLVGSAIYMLFQVGRVAIVTLLPALALSAVTGFDVHTCILVMGVICILYTVLGGIEAVVWSDVLQTVVLLGGALWALVIMVNGVDGGISALVEDASQAGKTRIADLSMDLTQPSLLVMILAAIFINIIPYASDQSVVQRYLTTRDEASARRAIWTGGLLSLPASLIFFGLGTALWAFYRENPGELEPTSKLDQILPFFVVDQLPAGIAGLVIAGVFAAAMSSLDSSMNSVATSFTTDWYRRFKPNASDGRCLRVARIATVMIGSIGTGAALVMASLDDASLLDVWFKVIGLFGSGLAGLFVLGAVSRRASPFAAWCGLASGAIAVFLASNHTNLNAMLYAAIGLLTCVFVGIMVGVAYPMQGSLPGLTLRTLNRSADD